MTILFSYLTVSPLHHVVLSHQHLHVDFCNSLLTTLPACALVKPSQIASLLCSKPSNGWLLFPLKIKASHKNYNRESPPRVFMTSLNLSTMFPFILSAPAAPALLGVPGKHLAGPHLKTRAALFIPSCPINSIACSPTQLSS